MFKRILSVVLAAFIAFTSGNAFAATTIDSTKTFVAQGTVTSVSTFDTVLKLVATDAAATQFNFAAGSGIVPSNEYGEVTWNDNRLNFQAITIGTDNRVAAANPKYTGPAQGSGLVGQTDTTLTVPLQWAIFPVLTDGTDATKGLKGYTMTAAGDREFFVTDKLQGSAAECTDSVTGAFESGAACDADDPIIDWDGDGIKGAKPFDVGYATMVSGLASQIGNLGNSPWDANPTVNDDGNAATPAANDGPQRQDANGQSFVRLVTNYSGAPAQGYKTSKLLIELVTIS